MRNNYFKYLLSFFIMLTLSYSVNARNVIFFSGENTNVLASEISASLAIISREYFAFSGDQAIKAELLSDSIKDLSPQEKAKSLNADNYVIVDIVKLSSKIIIDASIFEITGDLKQNASTIVASLDDMVSAGRTIASVLASKKVIKFDTPAEAKKINDAQSFNIVSADTKEIPVKNVSSNSDTVSAKNKIDMIMGVKFGLIHLFEKQATPNICTFGFSLRIDAGKILADVSVSPLFFPLDGQRVDSSLYSYGGINFDMGANYVFPSKSSTVFYIGGGFQPRILMIYSNLGFGLAPYAQIGTMFMRDSPLKIFINIKLAYNIQPIYRNSYYDTNTSKRIYDKTGITPVELGLEIGMGF